MEGAKMTNVMKRAWEMYKEAGCTSRYEFAIALRAAWAELKAVVTGAKTKIIAGFKSWFINKEFTQNQRHVIETALCGREFEVKKETEKAVLIKFFSDYGTIQSWFPKSVCEFIEIIAI